MYWKMVLGLFGLWFFVAGGCGAYLLFAPVQATLEEIPVTGVDSLSREQVQEAVSLYAAREEAYTNPQWGSISDPVIPAR